MTFFLLAVIVFMAQTVETVTGFGAMIIAVALGAHLLSMEVLIPVLVLVNLLLSAYIVVRHHHTINHHVLFRRIIPLMAVGLPVGFALFSLSQNSLLKMAFGLFVTGFAALELFRLRHPQAVELPPMPAAQAAIWLITGGIVHGIYASGGPLVVYYTSRQIADKGSFRSTLSALWLVLTFVLLASYYITGKLTVPILYQSLMLLPALLVAIPCGEWLHNRINPVRFRLAVFLLLLAAGLSLVASATPYIPK